MKSLLNTRCCVKGHLFLFIFLFMGILESARGENFSTIPIVVSDNTEICCVAANLSFDSQDIRIDIRDGVGNVVDSVVQEVHSGWVAFPLCWNSGGSGNVVRCTFSMAGKDPVTSFRGYMSVGSDVVGGETSECPKIYEATPAPKRRFKIR